MNDEHINVWDALHVFFLSHILANRHISEDFIAFMSSFGSQESS